VSERTWRFNSSPDYGTVDQMEGVAPFRPENVLVRIQSVLQTSLMGYAQLVKWQTQTA
jgi:hypothetical protein